MMLIAEIVFWGEDKGGRITPPQSGFKPQVQVGNVKTSCVVTSVDDMVKKFDFGKPYLVELELKFPDEYGEKFSETSKVELFEGSKQIAEGKVIKSD